MLLFALLLLANSGDDHYRYGLKLFETGQAAAAAAEFARAVTLQPSNAQFQKALGVAYSSLNQHREAEGPLALSCKLDPKLEDACFFYARNQYALDRFKESLELLEKMLASDLQPARVHLAIAQAKDALGQATGSEAAFRKAIDVDGKSSKKLSPSFDPHLHYGVFLFRQGRVAEAVEPLLAAVQNGPASAKAHFELGRAYYQLGKLREAEQHFQRAKELGFGEQADLLLDRTLLRLRLN